MTLIPDKDICGPALYSQVVTGLDSEGNPFEETLRWDFDNRGWIPSHMIYRAHPADYPRYQRGVVSWQELPADDQPNVVYEEA